MGFRLNIVLPIVQSGPGYHAKAPGTHPMEDCRELALWDLIQRPLCSFRKGPEEASRISLCFFTYLSPSS